MKFIKSFLATVAFCAVAVAFGLVIGALESDHVPGKVKFGILVGILFLVVWGFIHAGMKK